MIAIQVNGTPRQVASGATVSDLIDQVLGAQSQAGVAVAVNGAVVLRTDWPAVLLSSGDAIEIIRATQGG